MLRCNRAKEKRSSYFVKFFTKDFTMMFKSFLLLLVTISSLHDAFIPRFGLKTASRATRNEGQILMCSTLDLNTETASPKNDQLFQQATGGFLDYRACVELAFKCHARLPCKTEVQEELKKNGNRPLYPDRDMWWPVSDAHNTWVSVGNYDPERRLGRTHNELYGPPKWGEESRLVTERLYMAIVPTSLDFLRDTKLDGSGAGLGGSYPPPIPHAMLQQATGGHLDYQACVALAEQCKARLPTKAEVQKEIENNGNRPLYPDRDMWWPVSDAHNTWVSVGNFDPERRLGRTHNELYGPPEWGEESRLVTEREFMAIVPTSLDFMRDRYTDGWGAGLGASYTPPLPNENNIKPVA